MNKICLWGTSLNKPGDEAQVLAIIKLFKSKHPNVQIRLFSKYTSLLDQISNYQDGSVKAIRTIHIFKVLRALKNADKLVFIGAPFFEDLKQSFISFYLYILSSLLQVNRCCFAITIFPIQTWWGKRWYQFLFNKMTFIVVRDKSAIKVLQSLNLRKTIDLIPDLRYVLDLPGESKIQQLLKKEGIDPEDLIIGFTSRYLSPDIPQWVKKTHGYTKENVDNINLILADIAAHFENRAKIVVFPMHPNYEDDQKMTEIISSKMYGESKATLLQEGYRATEIIAFISKCDILIACRAGSAIFGSAANIPMLGIAYDNRLKVFMHDFDISEFVVDWKDTSWSQVEKLLLKMEREKSTIKQKMVSKTNEISAKINQKVDRYFP